MSLVEHDLFGEIPDQPKGAIRDKYRLPPFSVLSSRDGDWQDRKRLWMSIGLKSEGSREDIATFSEADGEGFYSEMVAARGGSVSIFDPVLCELMYDWFCPPGGQIIDPFAGGSVRGVVAATLGYRYWGCDIRQEQIDDNYKQMGECLSSVGYFAGDLTPVQSVGDYWLKRDDLCLIHGARGGKARTCWALAQKGATGLTTAGSRHSPQVLLVATMANALGLPFVAHVPEGDISEGPVAEAIVLGAEVIQHKAGYNSVIVARCREYAEESGYTEIPFGMECEEAINETRKQVRNIPLGIKRIVVPVGSAMSLSGILQGLIDTGREDIEVVGVVVGADPRKRLEQWAPFGWETMVTLITSEHDYSEHVDHSIGDINLDPVYEAKCAPYLTRGDLLWVVGHRDNDNEAVYAPEWVCGDSALEVATVAPPGNFFFSCPPYGDLEVYSDLAEDISNMDYANFYSLYSDIISDGIANLEMDSFACFVVGEYRDKKGNYVGFVPDTIRAFEAAGARFYNEGVFVTPTGSLPVRIGKQFESGRKLGKTHQTILTFIKGDAKKATAKITGAAK